MSIFHFLLLVTAILTFGSIVMLFVRASAPQFSALGWIAAAFAAGSLSIMCTLASVDVLGGVLPNLMLLVSFVLLQIALSSLYGHQVGVPRLGAFLLILEVVNGLYLTQRLHGDLIRSAVFGVLVAVQAVDTIVVALSGKRKANRGPAWLIAIDLFCFVLFLLGNSFQFALPGALAAYLGGNSQTALFSVYLLAVLGFAFGFFWLATELRALDLEDVAGTDPLTRAANRRNFLLWCEQERERSLRTKAPFAIVMVDIDHFKQINDTFGHAAGDTVICDVVEKMRGALRGIDILGRWGGEEFIVLLRESNIDAARIVGERIRSSVECMDPSAPSIRYGSQRKITVSVGIASHNGQEDVAELIAGADTALYSAKTGGRNRVQGRDEHREAEDRHPIDVAATGYESPGFTVPKLYRRKS